ncbi:MAG: hypothetical protein KAW02_04310 [candidate division Zixibacteria bacterium]|nr:hypothetical protein [candidate division Zixibacteria bacterium]
MLPKIKYVIALLFCLTVTWGCESHLEKAEKYGKEGKIAEAIKEYELALEGKGGKEATDICLRIVDLYLGEDTVKAIYWCQETVRHAPRESTPYIRLAEIFSGKDEVDSALWYYSKAQGFTSDEAEKEKISSLIEGLDFRKAKKIGTFQACIEFAKKYPHSKYKEQAQELAFHIVKSKPTVEKVKKFLEVFSDSKNVDEVKKIGKDLEKRRIAEKVNRIHKDTTAGELHPPDGTDENLPGGKVKIDTENDTQYLLRVYYVGPETLSVFFQPRQTKTIELSGGNYQVAAEVDNPTVNPFKGTHAYKEGWSYTSRFYITIGY